MKEILFNVLRTQKTFHTDGLIEVWTNSNWENALFLKKFRNETFQVGEKTGEKKILTEIFQVGVRETSESFTFEDVNIIGEEITFHIKNKKISFKTLKEGGTSLIEGEKIIEYTMVFKPIDVNRIQGNTIFGIGEKRKESATTRMPLPIDFSLENKK